MLRSNLIGSRARYVVSPFRVCEPDGFNHRADDRFEDMVRLINAVKMKPVIDKVFDFEHVRDAYEYQQTQQHVGKIVIKVSK